MQPRRQRMCSPTAPYRMQAQDVVKSSPTGDTLIRSETKDAIESGKWHLQYRFPYTGCDFCPGSRRGHGSHGSTGALFSLHATMAGPWLYHISLQAPTANSGQLSTLKAPLMRTGASLLHSSSIRVLRDTSRRSGIRPAHIPAEPTLYRLNLSWNLQTFLASLQLSILK